MLPGNLKGRDHAEDQVVNQRKILLKLILQEQRVWTLTGF
jgi:hypothetical protein